MIHSLTSIAFFLFNGFDFNICVYAYDVDRHGGLG